MKDLVKRPFVLVLVVMMLLACVPVLANSTAGTEADPTDPGAPTDSIAPTDPVAPDDDKVISVEKVEGKIILRDDFVTIVPNLTVDEIIAAAGKDTKIFKGDEDKEAEAEDKLATGMRVVRLDGDGKIVASRDIVVIGDVSGDGEVEVADARLALRAAVGLNDNLTDAQNSAACIEHDLKSGAVKVGDARHILRAAVDLDKPSDWLNGKFDSDEDTTDKEDTTDSAIPTEKENATDAANLE